jgi:hypothetical protein
LASCPLDALAQAHDAALVILRYAQAGQRQEHQH